MGRPRKLTFDECWSPGAPTECWLWKGSRSQKGYGQYWIDGRHQPAHRLIYKRVTGVDPGKLDVLHRCDVRACGNPSHLFLGTNADNVADRVAKQRSARGEQIGTLTAPQVLAIREAVAAGATRREMARAYDVSHHCINSLVARRTWTHL